MGADEYGEDRKAKKRRRGYLWLYRAINERRLRIAMVEPRRIRMQIISLLTQKRWIGIGVSPERAARVQGARPSCPMAAARTRCWTLLMPIHARLLELPRSGLV